MTLIALLLLAACTTDRTRRGYLRDQALALGLPSRPVIVVPGFGVTRLYDPKTGRFVWGTPRTMVHRRYEDDLELDARDRLVPRGYAGSRGPVNVGWQIVEALRRYGRYTPEKDVHPFEYDWRLSARDNARRLAALVDEVRAGGKVDIVTHSAGAIVALAYVKLAGGAENVEHLILIAPTQRGVIDAYRILVRPEKFIRRVFTADMVNTWPFVFELLPEDGRFLIDESGAAIDSDAWSDARWTASLSAARAFRDELRTTPLPAGVHLTVLAGDCVPTAKRALHRSDGTWVFYRDELRPGEEHLAPILFEPGDGTVPVSSARADGPALLFCDGHQGIATDPNVHRTLIRLLRDQR
jgi:hypothetical protein